MAFTKITNSDLTNKGVIGLPDVPGLSTANMQNKLEETARDVIIPKHNGLIDELEASTAASSIGATAPTGLTGTNVQSLINDLNLKKEDNAGALPTADTAGATDTFTIRKLTTSYKITFSDLVASIKDAIGNATTSLAGLFSAEDKTKLDGIEANANDYTLPAATASTLGGIKVGNNLQVTEDGTLSTVSSVGDMKKSVYDTNDSGVVDSAESVAWSGVSSKPSTISGYGITDAYTKSEVDSAIPDDLADLNDDSTHRLVTDSDKTSWNGKIANGYKRVKVGTTNVDASGEDAIEFIAGTGMTITPDATNKEITFTSTGGGTNVEGNPAGSATAGSLNKLKIDDDIYSVPQGTVTDAYKTIKVGSTSIDASSEDTFELRAGSNVTLTPDASTKSVTISATGGGQSSGDMLASDYDPNYTVKNTTGGITGYVSGQISDKADKVSSATSGNFAALDSNGNLTDSGHKHSDYLTSHQDISGKADKVTGGTSGNFASLDSNGNLADSGHKHSDYLTSHQDISGKADKVTSATNGNFAGLDSSGNLTDSGKSSSDFMASDGVTANPTGTATGTLTKLGIGSDIYEIQGGGASALANLTDVTISNPTDGQVLQYDDTSGKWINNSNGSVANKVNKTDVAPIESGSTASQAYAIGQQFYLNDILYQAKTAISQGATFTIGTNCELANNLTNQLLGVQILSATGTLSRQAKVEIVGENVSVNNAGSVGSSVPLADFISATTSSDTPGYILLPFASSSGTVSFRVIKNNGSVADVGQNLLLRILKFTNI